MFSKYLEKGYVPLPIGYLTKSPCVFVNGQWKNYNRLGKLKAEPVTQEDCRLWDTWLEHGAGIGIALGEHSGVIALDFDSDDEYTDKIKRLLPVPLVRKVGSKGETAFYRYSGEKNKKFKGRDGIYALEVLSTGNQTVIPPSYHPTTKRPYTWVDDVSLLDFDPKSFPVLPENFYEKVEEILGINRVVTQARPVFEPQETTRDDIEQALSFIDPNCPYDEWLEIGMALKDELGDSGFYMFDSWSASSHKYPKKGEPSTQCKWRSFKNSGITISTLFKRATLAGYKKEYEKQPDIDVKDLPRIPFIERLKMEAAPEGAKDRIEEGFPLHLCREAPGLVGDVQKWIEKSAMFPQPILALGAAISAVGILYGQKVKGSTDSRTNMYCLGVAPSGSGKEHPRKCVESLLSKLDEQKLLGGDPASSSGLLRSLKDGQGKRIVQIDEFGRVLKGMMSKNASSHVAGLPTVMMKLFSSASSTYFGTEYANHDGKQDRKDIDQPCLCIHASTVPEHLFQAMTGSDAVDGFLSRWLIFEEQGYPDPQIPTMDKNELPQSIIDKYEDFKEHISPSTSMVKIQSKMIPFSDEAREMANEFCVSMRKRAQQKQKEGDPTYAIWTRTFEHATKLALVGQEGGVVSKRVMKWALEVATFCSQYLCDQATSRIADNEQEKSTKELLRIIKLSRAKGVKHSELVRKTQKLTGRERNDIIFSLIESEQIEIKEEKTKTKPIKKYFYIN